MGSTTVRVSAVTHEMLSSLAAQEKDSMANIIERAVEEYRKKKFWDATNQAFARLRENKEAWEDELAERAGWDVTLNDGLDPGG